MPSFTPSSKFPHLPSASYSKPLCLSPAWGRAGLARVGGPARRTRVNAPALSQWCKEIRLLTISVSPSGTARRCALHHIPSLGHLPADIPCVGFPVLLGHSLLVLKSCLKMCFWGLLPCPPAMAEMESQDSLVFHFKKTNRSDLYHGNLEDEVKSSVSNSVRGIHLVLTSAKFSESLS